MRVRSSIKKKNNKIGDKLVKRKGRVYRINKTNPRRKERQG